MIDLKTTTESIVRQIANIEKVRTGEQLPTENERLVAYAAKIGNHDEWINNKGNLIYMLNKVTSCASKNINQKTRCLIQAKGC